MAYSTPTTAFPLTLSEIEMENQRYYPATTMDTYRASSSTSADPINNSSGHYKHDVFINHRGPDTKKNFASHLYRRLLVHGFRPFLDQQELEEGLNFPSQIEEVIRSASVHVALFSPTYVDSPWCLRELDLMLESKAPIIPIFYHVDPAELRWATLDKLQMKKTVDSQSQQEKPRYDSDTLQKWRDALSTVAHTSGFELKDKFNGDEGLLLHEVVKRLVKIMAGKTQLHVAKNPTGLDDKVEDFETTILRQQQTEKVQVVGIVGSGGVGKTTLSKEFFNRKHSEYSNSYFLSDIRENARSSLHFLQSKLLKGLYHFEQQIDDIHQGTQVLKQYLSSSKILLILDDIDHRDQVDALLPYRNGLYKDSLILITTRDEGVLASSGVKESSIYKLTGLTEQHSQELFCSYAFCQRYPLPGFEHLVNKFLMACDGLPLSLIVFGALLSGEKEKSYWEAILNQLKVPKDIKDRLKISYDSLSEDEQQIFLDIACFFIRQNKNNAIWSGSLGFKNLERKCLVQVDEANVIHMHDHLRDLGRELADNKSPRRLWRPTGNIDEWLQRQSSVITEARGIRLLPERHSTTQTFSCYQRSHQLLGNCVMKLCDKVCNTRYCFLGLGVMNLQLLESEGYLLERILRVHTPNLIWLSWRDCPYTYLPSWLPFKNLRVLRVKRGKLKTLWQGKSQVPLQLQALEIIVEYLSRIPKSIGQLKHLERIVVFSSSLTKLPEEIGHLKSLRALVLQAGSLKSLPKSLGKLTNLHHIDLSRCLRLEGLPDSFGNLKNLHHMDLSQCKQLESLPDSFGRLTNLYHMDLSLCEQLERLPDSFGSLTNLYYMDLSRCHQLERLPDSFGSLTNLYHMDLSRCNQLERLPDSFGSLTNLYHMDLSRCLRLERLPDSLGGLANLQRMDLSECEKLERLPDSLGGLANLQHMNLSLCKKLERLPDSLGGLANLQHMNLYWCLKLERLPDSLGGLANLQLIDLCMCEKLERLPNSFGNLSSLKYFDASSCSNLTMSSDTFGNIRTLEHIDLSACEKIEVWPSQVAHQRSLKILRLNGTNLKELPSSIGVLSDLEVLWIGSPLLNTLPPWLSDMRNLKELRVEYCKELKCLTASVGGLSRLAELEVDGCPVMEVPFKKVRGQRETVKTLKSESSIHEYMPRLQSLSVVQDTEISKVSFNEGVCPNLKDFNLTGCINLAGVETLPSTLTSVSLYGCHNLRSIEGLSGLAMLRSLAIRKCNELQELPSVETLVSLEYLDTRECVKLKSIRDLAQLTKLRTLGVTWCVELEELEGVEYCISLRYLDAWRCPKLRLSERVVKRLRQNNVCTLRD